MRRFGLWAGLAAGVLATGTGARAEDPAPTRLDVRTDWLEYTQFAKVRRADDKADRVAAGLLSPVALATQRPAGLVRVSEVSGAVFGTFRGAGRDVFFALLPGTGPAAAIAVDLNGDGDLTQPGESIPVTGQAGQGRVTWTTGAIAVGAARLDLVVSRQSNALWTARGAGGAAVPIPLSRAAPAGVVPPAVPGAVMFGRLAWGGRDVDVALLPSATGLTVVVDADGDKDLSEPAEARTATLASNGDVRRYAADGWTVGGTPLRIEAEEATQAVHTAGVKVVGARRGTVTLGGVPYALHLVDNDFDGAFRSPVDRWWFGPTAVVAKLRELSPKSMIEADEPAFAPEAWRLAGVDPDGTAHLVRDPAAGTMAQYLARRSERVKKEVWFPKFQQDSDDLKSRILGVLPARPLATKPVAWMHDVDLDAALARAKAEGKPLLVDFEADWCEWCYRFERYLYTDAEVARELERFVPVKISFDFHTAGIFQRLNAPESLPVIFFLDDAGEPVTFTTRGKDGAPETTFRVATYQTPATFAETLRAAHAAWRQRKAR